MTAFFAHVYPIYPFLDRDGFESDAADPELRKRLIDDVPWCILYHTVLALGLSYEGHGSYRPFEGDAWSLFSVALKAYSCVLLLPKSLLVAQVRIHDLIHHIKLILLSN